MTDAEKQFREENGMSLDEAISMVRGWIEEGKIKEAERGRGEILKFFPNHEIQTLFPQKEEESVSELLPSDSTSAQQPPRFLQTAKKFLNEKTEKIREMSKSPEQTHIPQAKPADENERLLGVFCYAWFFVLVPLFLRRDSAFVQFHAFQGLVLTASFVVFDFLILGFLEIFFGGSLGFAGFLLKIIVLAIYGMGAYSAWQGKWFKIPVVSGISEKLQKTLEK